VHKYIESGSTEYDHLLVVAMRALEMMGGRVALVGGKMPQQHLLKCRTAYDTVNASDMTKEERFSYQKDINKRRYAAFVDAHCGMKAYAYFTYITSTSQGQTKGTKMQGLHARLPEAERRRKGKSLP
jgi:hypothetical protein